MIFLIPLSINNIDTQYLQLSTDKKTFRVNFLLKKISSAAPSVVCEVFGNLEYLVVLKVQGFWIQIC